MNDAPRLVGYNADTRQALIQWGDALEWVSDDDAYTVAYAWFDLARELAGRKLVVDAVRAS